MYNRDGMEWDDGMSQEDAVAILTGARPDVWALDPFASVEDAARIAERDCILLPIEWELAA